MVLINLHGLVKTDRWCFVADGDPVPAEGPVIVTWSRWQSAAGALRQRPDPVGVRVDAGVAVDALGEALPVLELVAIEFPRFVDGRGYSLARLIRERFGFAGELRAVGEVLRDQVYFMKRCGFDAFELRSEPEAQQALAALGELTVRYQPAADTHGGAGSGDAQDTMTG